MQIYGLDLAGEIVRNRSVWIAGAVGVAKIGTLFLCEEFERSRRLRRTALLGEGGLAEGPYNLLAKQIKSTR